MLNPDAADVSAENQAVERFGVKDVRMLHGKIILIR
jgi:hypothetical protein